MKAALKSWRPVAIAFSVAATVVVLGCGDNSGLGRRYKVTGKVTYKGELVPKGTVKFLPTQPPPPDGRGAAGEINNGYYSLSTAGNDDGALPGEYVVAIVSMDLDLSTAKPKDGGAIIRLGDPQHKAALKKAKQLVPTKYGSGETSKLKATVKEESNQFDFDLTD
jgi:hypothetical protein